MKEYTKNLGKVIMTPKGAWSIEKEYEILDIVHDSVTDHAYISKQEVPSGVDLSDSRYWMPLNVSGYSDSNVITLNSFNENGEIQSYTLEEAIKVIKDVGRKSGTILIFYNNNVNRLDITTGCWEIWQFNSINVYDWENLDAWVNIYYNYNKFVGWYAAENTLNIEIPNPDIGCYAFVGNIYNEAFVYRCDIKNRWTKTNQKAQHYIKVVFGDNIIIGENGNWWQNGIDTNIPVSVKGDNGLTPYLRWSINNQIEYSYDNVNWYILSNKFITNIKIKDYVNTVDKLPNNIELGTIYGVGPIYAEDDTEQTNPIYNLYVYTSNGWINNGVFNSITAGVVQETGNSETEVMSQAAVSKELTELESKTDTFSFVKILQDNKTLIQSLIKDIYVSNADNSQEIKLTYFGINHSVFGGNGYIGVQVGYIKEGELNNTYLPTNYKADATVWKPNSLYELTTNEGNLGAVGVRVYVRTSENFSLPSSTFLINSVDLIRIHQNGKGNNVVPFLNEIQSNISKIEGSISDFENTHQFVNIFANNKAIFQNHIKAIYAVGVNPENNDVVLSYFGINSTIFVGEGYVGMQVGYYNQIDGLIMPTNYRAKAYDWKPNSLYELEGEYNNLRKEGVRIFIRTAENFNLTSDVVLFSGFPILKLNSIGKGTNVEPFLSKSEDRKHIIVDVNGKGDYLSLTEATNNADDGSTIIVMPGVYKNECVVAGKTKTLYIIGIDRDKCIIKNNYGDYYKAPIHISSGCLRNLTIISESTHGNEYAVHADFDTMINSSLNIENCTMQSYSADAGGLGVGLRGGGHLTVKSCRIISSQKGRALYLHDNDINLDTHFGLQKFSAIDCIFESPDEAIVIQGQGKSDRDFTKIQFYIEFIRNAIKGTIKFTNWYNNDLGEIGEDDFQGVKNLRLLDTSFGNSNNIFNVL